MSSSILLSQNLILFNHNLLFNSSISISHASTNSVSIQLGFKTKRQLKLTSFISKAENHSRKSNWWQKFFSEEYGNWLGLKDDDMVEIEGEVDDNDDDEELSEDEKFEAWKRRAEAIIELKEAREDKRNEESRNWEDWLLDDGSSSNSSSSNSSSWEQGMKDYRETVKDDFGGGGEKGMVESFRYFIFGRRDDDDMLYEDRVFQYASSNSVTILIYLFLLIKCLVFL